MGTIVIVGSGLSGAVLAERYASILKKKVLIIEKRSHIGGNVYDYKNKYGLFVMKYGGHVFHTNDEIVWTYINRFCRWMPYRHKVLSFVDNKLVPIPVNITTVNTLFHLKLKGDTDMRSWLSLNAPPIPTPKNSEEMAISRVGKDLYEKMFKNYTFKQWNLWPKDLEPSVTGRIPVRYDSNPYYFSDKYEAIPRLGYTNLIHRLLANPLITIQLNTDFFKIKDSLPEHDRLFFTGPIDQYFQYKYQKLQYRSLKFVFTTYKKKHLLPTATVNYPSASVPFTRIVEHKYFYKQRSPWTTVSKEYPTDIGEPYYPVPSPANRQIYSKYQKLAMRSKNIHFVGRLANYKYFNMDEAIRNALNIFSETEHIPI